MKSRVVAVVVAMAMTAAAAAQSDMPRRKSGLWEVSFTGKGQGRPMRIQECVDQKTDDFMNPEMDEDMKCDTPRIRREGASYVVDATCKVNGSTAKTRAVFSGSFDSAYKVNAKTTFNPPYQGMRETSVQGEGKWLGPCKAGQKPGDVAIPGMPNLDELKGGQKKR